jgi:hypothetical protein
MQGPAQERRQLPASRAALLRRRLPHVPRRRRAHRDQLFGPRRMQRDGGVEIDLAVLSGAQRNTEYIDIHRI